MLTDIQIRKAKPRDHAYKLFDAQGLYLIVQPNCARWWRLKYRFHGKEKLISLGTYPTVSLADARTRRDDARRLVANGTNPSQHRQLERKRAATAAVETFGAIAEEWMEKFAEALAPITVKKRRERLKKHVLPELKNIPVRDVTPQLLLVVLRRVEAKGRKETAHRLLNLCGQIMRYAVHTGRAERDPSADLRGALAPVVTTHRAASTEPAKVGALLRMYDDYDGLFVTRCALRLLPLVFVRPGELRRAEWSEIDMKRGEWTVPPWKTKMRNTLTVPLSTQAIAILRDIQPVTGDGKYVFPSGVGWQRPMSDNTINAAMRRMGIAKEEMVAHGWRAVARTLLDEELGYRVDLIETQLGHAVKDPTGRAYNRTSFLKERREMMQAWANYLDALRSNKGKAESL